MKKLLNIAIWLVILGLVYFEWGGIKTFAASRGLNLNSSLINVVLNKPVEVKLVGTGSMYPTLYWDKNEDGPEDYDQALKENKHRVLPELYYHFKFTGSDINVDYPQIGFGDIVSFEASLEGKEDHYIKRVIGTPGDKIELKDGFVYRNTEKLTEPYLNKGRSTFGGQFIPECKQIEVPPNQYLVMGDNRKASFDSRQELGFVPNTEIDFVLPFDKQEPLKSTWKNNHELEITDNKVTLNTLEFVNAINQIRKQKSLPLYKIDNRLNNSSVIRANQILKTNNFEVKDAQGNSLFPIAMQNSGYSNILTAEYVIQGYYDAEELAVVSKESPDLKGLINGKDYQDIGVGVVNKNVNGCPTQVIVLHFGGYIPAKYNSGELQNWQKSLNNLIESRESWRSARGNENLNQEKVEELLSTYNKAIEIARATVNKIETSQWMSQEDQQNINEFENLIENINKLAGELNQR